MNKDYYKILGIDENASSDQIKKVYRKLAKKYHPDSHPNDKQAEARFKEISEAYNVLSDSGKRKKYDEFRKYGGRMPGGNFNGMNFGDFGNIRFESGSQGGRFSSQGADNMGFGDLFSQFFNAGRTNKRAQSRKISGQDVQADLTLPFEIAVLGGKQSITVNYSGKSKNFSVNIKPGIENEEKIRLRGQGLPGYGGDPGDLIITVHISPNQHFNREGLHIIYKTRLNLAQALLGTKIQVKTVEGKRVQLKIQPGSQNGQRLRLKGMGIKTKDGQVGDQFVEIEIILPKRLNDSQRKLFEQFARKSNMDY